MIAILERKTHHVGDLLVRVPVHERRHGGDDVIPETGKTLGDAPDPDLDRPSVIVTHAKDRDHLIAVNGILKDDKKTMPQRRRPKKTR